MSADDREFGLVMPFTVCESQGGPFDDAAFLAGYRCGVVDAKLAHDEYDEPVLTRHAELSQLDLIAMRNGFTMATEQVDDDWFAVTFTPFTAGGWASEGTET